MYQSIVAALDSLFVLYVFYFIALVDHMQYQYRLGSTQHDLNLKVFAHTVNGPATLAYFILILFLYLRCKSIITMKYISCFSVRVAEDRHGIIVLSTHYFQIIIVIFVRFDYI